MRITHDGKVGIGRTPSYQLDVETPNAATYVRFKITESYSSYSPMALILQGGANTTASIWMGDSADPNIGSITYYNTDNSLRFIANTIQGLKITNAGVMQCGPATDITPDSGGAGNLQISGNGYTGFIALNGTGMYIGHNSGGRNTYLMTNETVALELNQANQTMYSTATYASTTAAAANMHVSSVGQFLRSTSSAKYKTGVEDMADSYADAVLNLRPVWYRSLARNDRSDWSHWGLIAEEVAAIDPRLVTYGYEYESDADTGAIVWDSEPVLDADGNPTYNDDDVAITRKTAPRTALDGDGNPVSAPEEVQYARIVPLLINLIKRQDARIAALESA